MGTDEYVIKEWWSVCMDYLYFNPDGTIKRVDLDKEGKFTTNL